MDRLNLINHHLLPNSLAGHEPYVPSRSLNKLDWFKNNGWGYKDTEFLLGDDGVVRLTGARYSICNKRLLSFKKWAEEVIGLDTTNQTPFQTSIPANPSVLNEAFMEDLKKNSQCYNEYTLDDNQRIHHSHGHTLQEIYALRHGKFLRIADMVIFVSDHEQVEALVPLITKHNVVLIPYGGGTNVTQALMCDPNEKRMIVSLDMTRMNHIKWVDRRNMMACVEAGI